MSSTDVWSVRGSSIRIGHIILQRHRREAGERRGARAADAVIGGWEASGSPTV
jgi:hypothetical protein